jgi:hypothetical protein
MHRRVPPRLQRRLRRSAYRPLLRAARGDDDAHRRAVRVHRLGWAHRDHREHGRAHAPGDARARRWRHMDQPLLVARAGRRGDDRVGALGRGRARLVPRLSWLLRGRAAGRNRVPLRRTRRRRGRRLVRGVDASCRAKLAFDSVRRGPAGARARRALRAGAARLAGEAVRRGDVLRGAAVAGGQGVRLRRRRERSFRRGERLRRHRRPARDLRDTRGAAGGGRRGGRAPRGRPRRSGSASRAPVPSRGATASPSARASIRCRGAIARRSRRRGRRTWRSTLRATTPRLRTWIRTRHRSAPSCASARSADGGLDMDASRVDRPAGSGRT